MVSLFMDESTRLQREQRESNKTTEIVQSFKILSIAFTSASRIFQ